MSVSFRVNRFIPDYEKQWNLLKADSAHANTY